MSIDIEIQDYKLFSQKETQTVRVFAMIQYSPSEGYDADKLAALECELGPYIEKRLNDALKKKGYTL
jgi:hypothetical protein